MGNVVLSFYDIKKILRPDRDEDPIEDFRVIESWTEYEESGDDKNKKLEYLCYEFEAMNPSTGKKQRLFKAIRFCRVIRLPASANQSTSFMDMQQNVLASVSENECNLITVIANIIHPEPIGLLYLYGVQATARTLEEAKRKARKDFLGFVYTMQGEFGVLEMRIINAEEAEWLRDHMYTMDYMTVVRGIPKANRSGVDAGNKGIGGSNVNPDSQGTLENMILGMVDYEYIIEILSTPVFKDTIIGWQRQTQKLMTEWYSQLQGTKSLSFNLSMPMMYAANVGSNAGWNKGYSDGHSENYSQGQSYNQSHGRNVGESLSQSFGRSIGHSEGRNVGTSLSNGFTQSHGLTMGDTFGQSYNRSHGVSSNVSQGLSMNQGLSHSVNGSQSINQSQGISQNQGINMSHGQSLNRGQSLTDSIGVTQGSSYNLGRSHNEGLSHSLGQSHNLGYSQGQSVNISNSASQSHSTSQSLSRGFNEGFSSNWGRSGGSSGSTGVNYGSNQGHNSGNSTGSNWGLNGRINANFEPEILSNKLGSIGVGGGGSYGHNWGYSEGDNYGFSQGANSSRGWSDGWSAGQGHSVGSSASSSVSASNGVSFGQSLGYGRSFGMNEGWGASESYSTSSSNGISEGWGASLSNSHSQSQGMSVSRGDSYSNGLSLSQGASQSLGKGFSMGESLGSSQSVGQSMSIGNGVSDSEGFGLSRSRSISESASFSQSQTIGRSFGQSISDSVSESASLGIGKNIGESQSVGSGTSFSNGTGKSSSVSNATSGGSSVGSSSSMGLGPSIGYSKSYQWLNQEVKDLLELLEYKNERFKIALRGEGMFYTYVYIACPSLDALAAAQAVAKTTWQNEFAFIEPIQVLSLNDVEQKHLLYHFTAFSADITTEDVFGEQRQKYCTVLLPQEYVAYTHLPRVSEGGVFSIVQDIPKFSVPSGLKGEIYMGRILSAERYSFENGYRTPYDYRIDETALLHGFFTGASRSGKTVAAMRFVKELAHVRRKKTGKGLRIVVMDPKQDWRGLARYVEPERFRFYSMGNIDFHPVHINPWKVPKGVYPQHWVDAVIDIYCRSYGLLERGKQMLGDVIYELYDEAGVFKACDKEDWRTSDEIKNASANVNFKAIYDRMYEKKVELENPNAKGGRAGNDTRDAYARLLDRLSCFSRKFSIESKLYGTSDGLGIDELIGGEDEIQNEELKGMGMVTVLESKGLEKTFSNFIFGVITSGFYRYALAHDGGFLAPNQNETVLIIEEANEVLIGSDTSAGGQGASLNGESEFEQIIDQAAGYGLFVFAITQKISDMPTSIIANAGLIFSGRLERPDDVTAVVRAVGREERIDDRDLVKWFPRSPIGYFVCKSARGFDFKDAEPVLVQIARLDTETPTNLELSDILTEREARRIVQNDRITA